MQQNQIFETKQEFYNQIGLTKSLKDLEAIVKNYVMETFNNLAKNFPGVYSISWDQYESDSSLDPFSIKVNNLDYFKIRQLQNEFDPEASDYFGSREGRLKVKEKYPLFKKEMTEINLENKKLASKLSQAAEIFSKEIQKIDNQMLLLVFGKKITITVTDSKFNYFHHPEQETCDG